MKQILKLMLISLAILTISCSSSSDVIDTTSDNQKQLDKTYEEPVTKSQTDTSSKTKSTEAAKPKSDETPKAKSTEAAKPKSDEASKTKSTEASKPKSDEAPKAKSTEAAKPKSDETSKAKSATIDDKLMTEILSKIQQASVEGTLQKLDPVQLCSIMPKNAQFMCEQKVNMTIESEISNTSSDSQGNKNQRPKVDPDSENPCAAVPKDAKAECEKGIADRKKDYEASSAKTKAEMRAESDKYVESFDPNNIPKIAKFNFTDLDNFSRMSKIRSAVGHNYTYKTDEDDPTRQNCKSMKHYFLPIGTPKTSEAYSKTPHTFKWMTIKFYSPVNGVIEHVEYTENQYGTEANFGIRATDEDAKGYYFDYYHLALDPTLKVGSTVKAGQQVGTLGDENAYSEIAVSARISASKIHLISFLEVATDEIFNLYKNRGVNSPSDVIISREEKDANPLPCDNSDAGWFIGSSRSNKPDINFQKWVYESDDNWFSFK